MKKRILIILLSIIILPVVVCANENYVNYYGVEITSLEYSNLLELGFSSDEIYYMSEDEFNNNKNIIGNLEATTTRYFANIVRYDSLGRVINHSEMEITEEDYNSEELSTYSSATIETTYKKMTTTISATGSKYRYKVSLIWKKMPAVRSYDIIGIGIDNALVYVSSSLSFNQNYCISTSCTNTTTINSSSISETGAGVSFKLPTSTSITTLSSYLYFDVSKDTSSTITTMHAYGDYSHATSTIGGGAAQGFYVTAAGIDLDSELLSYYDSISSADATWTGSW